MLRKNSKVVEEMFPGEKICCGCEQGSPKGKTQGLVFNRKRKSELSIQPACLIFENSPIIK